MPHLLSPCVSTCVLTTLHLDNTYLCYRFPIKYPLFNQVIPRFLGQVGQLPLCSVIIVKSLPCIYFLKVSSLQVCKFLRQGQCLVFTPVLLAPRVLTQTSHPPRSLISPLLFFSPKPRESLSSLGEVEKSSLLTLPALFQIFCLCQGQSFWNLKAKNWSLCSVSCCFIRLPRQWQMG